MWFIFALISTILVSSSSLLEKKILFKEHALEFSARLSFHCFLISVPFFILFNHAPAPHLVPLAIIAATAVLGGIAFLFIMKSTKHMEVSEASPFIAIGPAVTALLGFLLLGESLTVLQTAGLSIIVIGIYIVELKDTHSIFSPFQVIRRNKYIHLIFFSLILYGLTDVLSKLILLKYDFLPMTYLFYYQLFLALFFLISIKIKRSRSTDSTKISKQYTLLVAIVALLTLGYRYTHLLAINLVGIGIAIAVHRSSTVITTIIGGKLYKEDSIIRKGIAAGIVILGVVLIAM